MNALEKLREQADIITAAADPLGVVDAWALTHRLIGRFPIDDAAWKRVFGDKDAAGLDAIVAKLENPEPKKTPPPADDPPVSEHDMTAALRAFHKRLKLARLGEESKLSVRLTTSGRKSQIDAIEPPREFPAHVWRALAKAGKLVHTGQSFYADPGPTRDGIGRLGK